MNEAYRANLNGDQRIIYTVKKVLSDWAFFGVPETGERGFKEPPPVPFCKESYGEDILTIHSSPLACFIFIL